ncbi:MFP1 attachment factor 1-like [Olea europaea var. sylvestris]|uniref:MFP1 attachment factor 1-like n=1 Tax=Olea europaea var. sylvestris TaxID=158386 RepID=UPI000C1D5BDC|nr:MFP1 attachment factor 1-like [Olea europaea var. sylvestris]
MSDKIEARQESEQITEEKISQSGTSIPPMAEAEQAQQQPGSTSTGTKFSNVSFSIWPPTERTRDAVRNRLIETLSSPSVLSKRYGTVPREDAADAATRIEEEAFLAAGAAATTDDDGIEILQVYSKEISKRMLDTVKSRSDEAEPESKPDKEPEVESKTEEQKEEEDVGSTAPPQSEKTESVVDDE